MLMMKKIMRKKLFIPQQLEITEFSIKRTKQQTKFNIYSILI